jgi:TRAP transporter TAXI family solute receptor
MRFRFLLVPLGALSGAAVLYGLWLLASLIAPPPPAVLTIAAGSRGGAYTAFANQYQSLLAERGVKLKVRETAGSVENLGLLRDGSVDLAFVQGGTIGPDDEGLMSICSVFLEPLWIFVRSEVALDDLRDLRGLRVQVGPPGSGSRALAMVLLGDVGLSPQDVILEEVHADPVALSGGTADAAMLVAAPSSEAVRALLATRDVHAVSLRRQEAMALRRPFLAPITLPEGVIDLAYDLPGEALETVAAAASLVGPADLHPGVVAVLLRAAEETHGGGDLVSPPGRFPSPELVDAPLSDEARQYFESGPSFLYRLLPLWLASWLNRLFLVAVPLLTLLIPLSRLAPPLYAWRNRSRIYRWYEALVSVDRALSEGTLSGPAASARLSVLEAELLAEVAVPLSYMREYYALRQHLELVQDRAAELSPTL